MRYRSAPLLTPAHEVDHGSSAGVAPPDALMALEIADYAYVMESGRIPDRQR